MKPVFASQEKRGARLFQLSLMLLILFVGTQCNNPPPPIPQEYVIPKYINWNVLLPPGTSYASALAVIARIESSLDTAGAISIKEAEIQALDSNLKFSLENVQHWFCPCDTLLWNITADIRIDSSGGASKDPPPGGGGVGASGELASGIVDENKGLDGGPEDAGTLIDRRAKLINKGTNEKVLLAVIDTGLDTTRLPKFFPFLIWGIGNQNTIYNTLPFAPASKFEDRNSVRHGTSVTYLALESYNKSYPNLGYPKIMVLKALDDAGSGSVFSVSCALSYAIKQGADLVNMSLGYYGEKDKILPTYLNKADSENITIVAAAGNTPGEHPSEPCGETVNTENFLQTNHLFFPGCYSDVFPNMVTVTGLATPGRACLYQNYSSQFVTVGVLNSDPADCCRFAIPYINGALEGSSFATPIISGLIAGTLDQNRGLQTRQRVNKITQASIQAGAIAPIREGRYVNY